MHSLQSPVDANLSALDKIIQIYQAHPAYPFDFSYCDYAEYVAATLMVLDILKAYIPHHERADWTFVTNYYDIRRHDPESRTSLISCINLKREQVFFLAIQDAREREDADDDAQAIYVAVERDDFYGGKWEENVPVEQWFSIFQIVFDLSKMTGLDQVDQLLKTYFNQKLSFTELRQIQQQFCL
ncbi:hypothetical protein EC844_11190 [Acinetobacter calcoaceticus]|uniref:Uncharacterized protein n=1 Tax=Acinetobacter calcoaceticus TaxID=471 RepID=A0A4R1XW95_ACICA|nr:hypothetical protein EC844_11190 [Acinetobacter calcoaceticus]